MWFEHGEEGIVVGEEGIVVGVEWQANRSITYSTSVCGTVGKLELVVGRVRRETVWSFQSVMYNMEEFRAGLVDHDGLCVCWLGGDRIHGLGAPREHIGPLN